MAWYIKTLWTSAWIWLVNDSRTNGDKKLSLNTFKLKTSLFRLNQCWWRMLEMVNVCDNGTMLVTDYAILLTKIRHLLKLVSDTNISKISPTSKFCYQHHVTNFIIIVALISLKQFWMVFLGVISIFQIVDIKNGAICIKRSGCNRRKYICSLKKSNFLIPMFIWHSSSSQ